MNEENVKSDWEKVRPYVIGGVVGLFALIILFSTVGFVGAGERGVHTRAGAVTGSIKGEGMYAKVPFIEGVVTMSVQTQKVETPVSAASKDLQTVNTIVALNYRLSPESVATLYQNVRREYETRLIAPTLQEGVKAVTAQFTAEELITRRPEVRDNIRTFLQDRLQANGIIVTDFNIIDFEFSKSFDAAIEAKVTAEQDALAAKNKLEQTKYEAQQQIESAKGKAEALRIEGDALRANQQLLELRAIEKWNGDVPQYWGGGAIPFINVQ